MGLWAWEMRFCMLILNKRLGKPALRTHRQASLGVCVPVGQPPELLSHQEYWSRGQPEPGGHRRMATLSKAPFWADTVQVPHCLPGPRWLLQAGCVALDGSLWLHPWAPRLNGRCHPSRCWGWGSSVSFLLGTKGACPLLFLSI